MPVVFLDGVDGSGKTALGDHLVRALGPIRTRTVPPLWRFLPELTTPADFGPWATSSDANHVAVALTAGQTRRISSIRPHEGGPADPVIQLVDRGPATAIASARAQLRTGTRIGNHDRSTLNDHIARLRDTVQRLNAETACLSIELAVSGSLDRILSRLADDDRTNPDYVRYLHALHDEITTEEPACTGQRRVHLDAGQPVGVNVSAALAAVHEMLATRRSALGIATPQD